MILDIKAKGFEKKIFLWSSRQLTVNNIYYKKNKMLFKHAFYLCLVFCWFGLL